MIRCALVETPDGLEPAGPAWDALADALMAGRPDLVVLPEMPFGDWLAAAPVYDEGAARAAIAAHAAGIAVLAALGVPAIVTSRPVAHGDRLANEAVVIEHGRVRALHRKQVFPEEPGWHETRWFSGDGSGFALSPVLGLRTGALLCSELMVNELARHYGADGADLIVVPRATDPDSGQWQVAGAMAAIVSGAYVVSANRRGGAFGGGGFAFDPHGVLRAQTTQDAPVAMVAIDPAQARAQKSGYPCYMFRPDR